MHADVAGIDAVFGRNLKYSMRFDYVLGFFGRPHELVVELAKARCFRPQDIARFFSVSALLSAPVYKGLLAFTSQDLSIR
jgi:hypothetical protein